MIGKDLPGTSADAAYAYDNLGRLTAATFPATGQGIFNSWDALGRLASTTSTMGGTSRTLAYQYDLAGNRTRITHPDDTFFRTDYDGLGRPAMLWANGITAMSSMGYYAHGGPAGMSRANGATSEWGYDALQRVSAVVQGAAGTSGDLFQSLTYNPASQIASRTLSNDSYAWTGHYGVTRAYTTNGRNQYTQAASTTGSGQSTTSFGYDGNGNLSSDVTPAGTTTYDYDAENRLVSTSTGATLTYDPLGRLFQVTLGASTTRFLYDGDALVEEYDGANILRRRYAHWVGSDVPLLSYLGTDLSQPSYLHADQQGSIVMVSDQAGNPSVNRYDEYGIPRPSNVGRFGYTGQVWLNEIGLYYYKARMYSPTLGRFMQTDPVGYGDGMNFYAYVYNDPVNFVDPTGLGCDTSDLDTNDILVCGHRWLSVHGGAAGHGNATPGTNTRINEASCLRGLAGRASVAEPVIPEGVRNVATIAGLIEMGPGALLLMILSLSGDTPRPQYVIRGGVTTPESLIRGTSSFSRDGSSLSGFSVVTGRRMSVDELALAAGFPNSQISVTTTDQLAGLGAPVVPTPTAREPLHATVTVPDPLSPEQAAEISGAFSQRPNPACRGNR